MDFDSLMGDMTVICWYSILGYATYDVLSSDYVIIMANALRVLFFNCTIFPNNFIKKVNSKYFNYHKIGLLPKYIVNSRYYPLQIPTSQI